MATEPDIGEPSSVVPGVEPEEGVDDRETPEPDAVSETL